MYISTKYAKILSLTVNDLMILQALETKMNISELSEKTGIARTSLYSMLTKLKKRDFLKTVKIGKRTEWIAVDSHTLAARIGELHSAIQYSKHKKEEKVSIIPSHATGFTLYRGSQNLINLYKRMLDLHKFQRLLILQPNQSTELVIKKFPQGEMNDINRHIQENKIIVEAIIHENAISHYIDTMRQHGATKELIFETFSAFNNRVADTTYIPEQFLTFKTELYIMEDTALIMNWEEEVGIEIKNADMVGTLTEMFQFIKSYGRKVDQNPIISKLLTELK